MTDKRIDWHGGACPVDPETKVRIFLRANEGWNDTVQLAGECVWEWDYLDGEAVPAPWDILKYEVVK